MAVAENKISLEQRIAKVEGILEQVNTRLAGVERQLEHLQTRFDHLMATKADKWEIRIWFIILMAFSGFVASLSLTILARLP